MKNIAKAGKAGLTWTCRECGQGFELNTVNEEAYNRLRANGINLPLPSLCSACSEKEAARQAIEIDRRPLKIPPEFRKTDPARLPQKQLKQVLGWEFGPKGLILHGPTGRGKTRSAWLLLQRLHKEGKMVEGWDSGDWSDEIITRYMSGQGPAWIKSLIFDLDVLMIDDLGNEAMGERTEGELYRVVKRRAEEGKPIIITTNTVGKDMVGRMRIEDRAMALIRRIREYCHMVEF